MSTLGIVLVLVSACTHALWNLLSKSTGDAVSFLRRALASMLWLEKDFSWPRLVGVLGITAGVVLVGLS
jgi:drug/metabolite transporter (DMT)-like permease